MSEELDNTPRTYSGALLAVIAIALLLGIGSLIWDFTLNGHLTRQDAALAQANQRSASLEARLEETNAHLRVATEELGNSLGLTQKQLDARAQDLIRREQADNAKLAAAQRQTAQQLNDVSSDVSAVKTDVGGVKTDVAKTQTDLAGAITTLTAMKGDISDHSSLIARNHDELEILKHKGDRNYYEFTLAKGQKKPVSTVSLELRKADSKKSRFTLVIFSDDKSYEKKDRNLNEPLQFYSGKDPMLYEIVVNSVSGKNQVTGYLATPKSAPVPPAIAQ
jgi:hypothetical protein